MSRIFIRANHSFSALQSILSKMKVAEAKYPSKMSELGTSNLFSYATDKKFKTSDLKDDQLRVWERLSGYNTGSSLRSVPMNGFDEAIQLTEMGRMWRYPIDNEQGLEEEQKVPFEEHVFLEKYLEDFPQNESIQTFMGFVVAGLAKNPWMTVDRKVRAIEYYKEYFESKRDVYKQAGFDM